MARVASARSSPRISSSSSNCCCSVAAAGRAPNLTPSDRLLCGFWSQFLRPSRLRKLAIAVRPSTLWGLHAALVRGKYRRLFSAHSHPRKPGPKGPSVALIRAIVELKSRNPRFGCLRIARIITRTFGVDIDRNVVRRVLGQHDRPSSNRTGPFRGESLVLWSYWVMVVMDQCTRRLVGVAVHAGAVTGVDLCCMFNAAIHGQGIPRHPPPIMIPSSRRTSGRRTCGF